MEFEVTGSHADKVGGGACVGGYVDAAERGVGYWVPKSAGKNYSFTFLFLFLYSFS